MDLIRNTLHEKRHNVHNVYSAVMTILQTMVNNTDLLQGPNDAPVTYKLGRKLGPSRRGWPF